MLHLVKKIDSNTILLKLHNKIICKFFFAFDEYNSMDIVQKRVKEDINYILKLYAVRHKFLTCYHNGIIY